MAPEQETGQVRACPRFFLLRIALFLLRMDFPDTSAIFLSPGVSVVIKSYGAAALRPADPEDNGQGAEPSAVRKRWKKRPAISI